MSYDPRSQPHEAAIAQLEAFRLSTYAARTYVALSRAGTATAKEVSDIAEVPRTRVYDAVEELQDRGFVEVEASNPQRFAAVSTERLRRRLEADCRHRISVLTAALDCLKPDEQQAPAQATRTIETRSEITARFLDLVGESTDELVYLADDRLLSAEFVGALSRAADQGVSITVGRLSDEQMERLYTEVPDADRIDPSPPLSGISRLMLIDNRKALVSTLPEETTPDSETATVAVGETNSLVVLLSSLLSIESEPGPSEA